MLAVGCAALEAEMVVIAVGAQLEQQVRVLYGSVFYTDEVTNWIAAMPSPRLHLTMVEFTAALSISRRQAISYEACWREHRDLLKGLSFMRTPQS